MDTVQRRAKLQARPLRIHLEVNDTCNLNCRMCARQSDDFPRNRGEMDIEVVQRLVPWFEYAGYVGLAGNGEPFLHSRIFEIIEMITATGAVPSIVTNATLLDKERVDTLIQSPPVLLLASIDGATSETYEYIRKGADFNKVVAQLRYLEEQKRQRGVSFPVLNFVVCVMEQNVRELSRIVELAHSVGATLVIAQNILPYNEWARQNMVRNPDLLRQEIARARETAAHHTIGFEYIPMGETLEQRLARSGQRADNGFFCEFIWQQFHVEVDGNVRYCCFWTKGAAGNLTEQSPEEIWNCEGFQHLRETLRKGGIPDDCRTCHMRVLPDKRAQFERIYRELRELWKK